MISFLDSISIRRLRQNLLEVYCLPNNSKRKQSSSLDRRLYENFVNRSNILEQKSLNLNICATFDYSKYTENFPYWLIDLEISGAMASMHDL